MKSNRLSQSIKGKEKYQVKYDGRTRELTIWGSFPKNLAFKKVLELSQVQRLEKEFPQIFGRETEHAYERNQKQ